MRAEQITPPLAFHAEGPVWWEGWGGLRWVDMHAGDVLSLHEDGGVSRRHVGEVAAALRPRDGGGAVIGVRRGFALEDPDGTVRPLPDLWSRGDIRMNDGGCDPDGAFWCGTMAYDQRPGAGALYRLRPDGTARRMLEGLTIANGLEWSPDGTRAYHVDTPERTVTVYDHSAEDGLVHPRTFARVDGLPDGLTVDAEGGVWVALYGDGAVLRLSPDGAVEARVDVPSRVTTACTFGGPGLARLFITTSREGLDPGEDPAAGAVFAADVGVRGLPARAFAG
jgi:sugar lactone lactonase YvrE